MRAFTGFCYLIKGNSKKSKGNPALAFKFKDFNLHLRLVYVLILAFSLQRLVSWIFLYLMIIFVENFQNTLVGRADASRLERNY